MLQVTLLLFALVIECRPGSISASYSFNYRNNPGNPYPHLYTGAFMSRGYPTRSAQNRIYRFLMYFGGQPSHTYTTIRLHSPPTLLSGARLNVRSLGGPLTGGFTASLSTPISIYTADTGYIYVEAPKPSRAQQGASFLFSFEGKVIYSNQARLPNFPLPNYAKV